MFHGLGQPVAIPPQLFPTIASGFHSKSPKGAAAAAAQGDPATPPGPPARAKTRKTRKKKAGGAAGEAALDVDAGAVGEGSPRTERSPAGGSPVSGFDSLSLQPPWARFTSSDSEFSETEGGPASRNHMHSTKVRVAALTCLASVCKVTLTS